MLNSRGLGEQVQRKKEAYQSNPQALQQQYQQSQQLVDLLALQQLKSEKEAAARNMQMQMQQNPATIAQQREQEVLGMIKQEQGRKLGDVAQRTAGTLGQINKRTQQNMQRAAKQGLPSMGGPQKPAMMAGGGIVAFSGGMDVSAPEKPGFFSQFSLPDMDAVRRREERIRKEKERLRAIGVVIPENITTEEVVEKINTALADPVTKQRLQEKDEVAAKKDDGIMLRDAGEGTLGGPSKTKTPVGGVDSGIMTRDAGVQPAGTKGQGLEALGLAPPTPTPTVVGTERQDVARTLIEEMGIKPEGTREEAREAAEARTRGILDAAIGREEGKLGPKESQLQRMRELQAQQTDPDKLRRERLTAGLLGAAGRGSTTLAGFGAGAFNQRRAQEAAARKNLTDQFGIENEKIQLDLDIASAQITSGQEAVELLAKDQQAATSAIQSAAADDVKMAIAEGNRKFDADMQGVKTRLELFLDQMEDRRAAAERAEDKELAYMQLATDFLKEKMKLEKEIMDDAGFSMADSEDEVRAAINRLETMTVEFHQMLEKGGVNDFQTDIQRRLGASVGGGTSGGGTSSGIDLNPDLAALVNSLAQ